MSLDADAKKVLLRKIPHGLFICGVAEGDVVNGFTASWVTQGSFEPPLVVMAVRADSTSNGMIQRTGKFSLNVLAADQKDLAAVFFKPQQGVGGRFDAAPYKLGEHGLPILDDGLGGWSAPWSARSPMATTPCLSVRSRALSCIVMPPPWSSAAPAGTTAAKPLHQGPSRLHHGQRSLGRSRSRCPGPNSESSWSPGATHAAALGDSWGCCC